MNFKSALMLCSGFLMLGHAQAENSEVPDDCLFYEYRAQLSLNQLEHLYILSEIEQDKLIWARRFIFAGFEYWLGVREGEIARSPEFENAWNSVYVRRFKDVKDDRDELLVNDPLLWIGHESALHNRLEYSDITSKETYLKDVESFKRDMARTDSGPEKGQESSAP